MSPAIASGPLFAPRHHIISSASERDLLIQYRQQNPQGHSPFLWLALPNTPVCLVEQYKNRGKILISLEAIE